jgi:hypothetical protein
MQIIMSDFYVVINSKATNTHPDNTPNNFVTTWEKSINLHEGKWKVGLTQIRRDKPQFKAADISLAYMKYERQVYEDTIEYTEDGLQLGSKGIEVPYEVSLVGKNTVKFSMHGKFLIQYSSKRLSPKQYSGSKLSWSEHPRQVVYLDEAMPDLFKLILFLPTNDIKRVAHGTGRQWSTYVEFLYFIKTEFSNVITKVQLVDNYVKISLAVDIYWFKISNDLMKLFRLEYNEFGGNLYGDTMRLESQIPVCLDLANTYIYSNICAPMMVGGAYRPLLAIVDLESKFNIVRPMYVDVVMTEFNTISINTLSDNDAILPYDDQYDKVQMTLHFINTSAPSADNQ